MLFKKKKKINGQISTTIRYFVLGELALATNVFVARSDNTACQLIGFSYFLFFFLSYHAPSINKRPAVSLDTPTLPLQTCLS